MTSTYEIFLDNIYYRNDRLTRYTLNSVNSMVCARSPYMPTSIEWHSET